MKGSELNSKYHELCGWRWGCGRIGGCLKITCGPKSSCLCDTERVWDRNGKYRMELPALHTDLNLAIAEADKVFRSPMGPDWELIRGFKGATVRPRSTEAASGATICEAILKALITATENAI